MGCTDDTLSVHQSNGVTHFGNGGFMVVCLKLLDYMLGTLKRDSLTAECHHLVNQIRNGVFNFKRIKVGEVLFYRGVGRDFAVLAVVLSNKLPDATKVVVNNPIVFNPSLNDGDNIPVNDGFTD